MIHRYFLYSLHLSTFSVIFLGKDSKQAETVKTLQFVVALFVLTFVERESQEGTTNTTLTLKRMRSTHSTYSAAYGKIHQLIYSCHLKKNNLKIDSYCNQQFSGHGYK